MLKPILTIKRGKHKGRTYYATEKTFDILYQIAGGLLLGLITAAFVILTAIAEG